MNTITQLLKSKSFLIGAVTAAIATFGGVKPCYAWDFQFIGQSGSEYTYGLQSTASDNNALNNDVLSFTNLFPGSTLSFAATSTGGSFTPGFLNLLASGSFNVSGTTFVKINDATTSAGFSTFIIDAPGATLGTIGVAFSGNTLDNATVQGPVASSGGGTSGSIPFEFSTTPGLLLLGSIFGLKKGIQYLKSRKNKDSQ